MSDFSNLLSQLQQSAKAQSQAPSKTTESSSQSGHLGKHDRSTAHSSYNTTISSGPRKRSNTFLPNKKQKKHDYDGLPRDYKGLSIKLSFLCIGAQKAGTTWLHKMLQQNPSICLPQHQKELHFWDWNRSKGLSWYSRQFKPLCVLSKNSKSSANSFYGEITPCYAALPPNDIHEIKSLFPDLRIVFLARDLLERTWSALLMELYQNVTGLEAGEFASTKKLHDKKHQLLLEKAHPRNYKDDYFMDRMEHSTHCKRTDYATCLRNWLDVFPKESILIIDYHNISKQPKSVLKMICHHIMKIENHDSGSKKNISGSKENKIDEYLNSLTKEELSKRINAAAETVGSSTPKNRIRPSLERKMKDFLRPMAEDFNALLKELGYDWSIDDFSHKSKK